MFINIQSACCIEAQLSTVDGSTYCNSNNHHKKVTDLLSFGMAFQPMIWLATGDVFAYEALLRGDNGVDGIDFINCVPVESRNDLDQLARNRAIEVGCQLGFLEGGVKLAVNCLPNVFGHAQLCIEPTLATADTYGLAHHQLIFEVTEHENIAEKALLPKMMQRYAHSLFGSSIDDFGAGYAGIGLLLQFQPTILKLDRNLVQGLPGDKVRTAIVKGMVSICRDLNILSAAEGIESEEEFDLLAELGVDIAQGYHVSRPVHEGSINSSTWSYARLPIDGPSRHNPSVLESAAPAD